MSLRNNILHELHRHESSKSLKTIIERHRGVSMVILYGTTNKEGATFDQFREEIRTLWIEGKIKIWDVEYSNLDSEEKKYMLTIVENKDIFSTLNVLSI